MTMPRTPRVALPGALLASAIAVTPALAFQPSVQIIDFPASWTGRIADVSGRGSTQAVSMDVRGGDGDRVILLAWSTNGGASWPDSATVQTSDAPHVESKAAVCAGRAITVFALVGNSTTRTVRSRSYRLDAPIMGQREWTTTGIARRPDAACVANSELAVAWFQKSGSGY